MKRKISALALLALSVAAYADTTEWIGTANGADAGAIMMSGGQLQNESHWSNGVPTADTDVIIRQNWTRVMGGGTLQMKSLEVKGGFGFLTLSSDEENAVKNGTYDQINYTAPTLIIGDGGLSFTGEGDLNIGSVDYRYGFDQVIIGGDIVFNEMGMLQICYNPNSTYGTDKWSLDVGGVVRMNGDSETQRFALNKCGNGNYEGPNPTAMVDAYVRMGGIDGKGYLYSHDPGATSTNIYFQAQDGKAFQGGDWTGIIAKNYEDNISVTFNLVMDGGADGGRQYLRLVQDPERAFDASRRPDSFNLDVKSGHIGIYNTNGSKFDNITLNGGVLEVAYIKSGTHDPAQEEMGFIHTDKLEINGDSQIIFDVSGGASSMYENDMIFVGEVSGDGQLTLVVELDANYFTDGQSLNESFNLFSITDANNYDWASALVKVMYNGSEVSGFSALARYDGDGTNGGVYVDISGVIPEPAEIASILGLAAIAFAAYRRRK